MRRVRFHSFGWDRPQFPLKVELRPPGIGYLALALTSQREQLEKRTIRIAHPLGRAPKRLYFGVPENPGPKRLLTDHILRLHTVARRPIEPVHATRDRPVKESADMAEQIVCLVWGSARDGGIKDRNHVVGRDARDRAPRPPLNELATKLALYDGPLALLRILRVGSNDRQADELFGDRSERVFLPAQLLELLVLFLGSRVAPLP